MNQEGEQDEGATRSNIRGGWAARRSMPHGCNRDNGLVGFDDIEQYNDVGSADDRSVGSTSEYANGGRSAIPSMERSMNGENMMSYNGSGAPCGACKFLRRKCLKDCVFAPYFGAEHGAARFAAVHKIFGASNVNKLLRSIPAHKRFDAVITISYEAQARITNPIYGCVALIAELQQQVQSLQAELSVVHSQLASSRQLAITCMAFQQQQQQQQQDGHGGGAFLPFDHTQPLEPVHTQHLFSQISSPPPPPPASYNIRPKHELENIIQPCMPHFYDNCSMGSSPNPPISTHMQHTHRNVETNVHPRSTINLTEQSDHMDAPSANASQLHALLRTGHLNLDDSP